MHQPCQPPVSLLCKKHASGHDIYFVNPLSYLPNTEHAFSTERYTEQMFISSPHTARMFSGGGVSGIKVIQGEFEISEKSQKRTSKFESGIDLVL